MKKVTTNVSMKAVKALLLASCMLVPLAACSDTSKPEPGDGDGNGNGGGNETKIPRIVINEVTSKGDDSVEFVNLESTSVDISGWYYMDSKLDLTQAYIFPAGTILQPGQYLVVNKDEHHTGFGIGDEDGIYLFNAADKIVDKTLWLAGESDPSWCRLPDGTGDFVTCTRATFGDVNVEATNVCGDGVVDFNEACDGENLNGATCASFGLGEGSVVCASDCASIITADCSPLAPKLVINEVTSAGDDNIELFNGGSAEQDLSGWYVMDADLDPAKKYVFPEGTTLAPGAYYVLVGKTHHMFGLGGADAVYLYDASGALIDQTEWADGDAKVATWCRLPNGTGAFQVCATASFGAANE